MRQLRPTDHCVGTFSFCSQPSGLFHFPLALGSCHAIALFPQYIGDVSVAFTSASCKFLKEVHSGDTLYSALEIIALTHREANRSSDNAGDGAQPTR
jgi:hypothetical protein